MNVTTALENPDIWSYSIDWEFCYVYYYEFAILFSSLYSQHLNEAYYDALLDHDYFYYDPNGDDDDDDSYSFNSYSYFRRYIYDYDDDDYDYVDDDEDDSVWYYWQFIYYFYCGDNYNELDDIEYQLYFGQNCRRYNRGRWGRHLTSNDGALQKKDPIPLAHREEQLSEIFKNKQERRYQ